MEVYKSLMELVGGTVQYVRVSTSGYTVEIEKDGKVSKLVVSVSVVE